MPWPVRSRLLVRYIGSITSGTVVILGVVPSGKTWLLKEFVQWNAAASACTLTFGTKIGTSHANAEQLAATGTSSLNMRTGRNLVLPAGTELYVLASVTGVQQIHISGAELG